MIEDETMMELVFLRYFFDKSDFGPCDQDVRERLYREYAFDTGYEVPEGYLDD